MNRKLSKVITYCKMSLLFMVLGSIVIYIAGKPLVDYAASIGNMAIVNGAPGFIKDNGELLEPVVSNGDTTDQSEIQTPPLNTQYGTISCDQIAMTAPLYYGDNHYALQNGAGQYTGSGLPGKGKTILIGGHDGTYFAPLKDIKAGDIVKIKTTYGVYEYQVTDTKVADKDDSKAYDLTGNKEQLILYTCYPFGKLIGNRNDRYYVYCSLKTNSTDNVK